MSSKRSESENGGKKRRRYCSEGTFKSIPASSDEASTGLRCSPMIQKHSSEGECESNPASSDSTNTQRKSRSQTINCPDYTKMGKIAPTIKDFCSIKVEPHEFVCLYQVEDDSDIPLYAKQGKKNSPLLEIGKIVVPKNTAALKESFSNEQKKRMECIYNCIKEFTTDLKHKRAAATWFDTVSNKYVRLKKCRDIVENYGFDEDKFSVPICLETIYDALLEGLNNGIASSAMYEIFVLSHLLLKGNSNGRSKIMNVGGASRKNQANSHMIRIIDDLDNFDKIKKEEMVKELMSGEIVNGVYNWATPDVALFKEEDSHKKWYFFGECMYNKSFESERLDGQIFRQCLRGLVDFDKVYGFGLTCEGFSLHTLEIMSQHGSIVMSSERGSFVKLCKHGGFDFDCDALLDLIIWISHKINLCESS